MIHLHVREIWIQTEGRFRPTFWPFGINTFRQIANIFRRYIKKKAKGTFLTNVHRPLYSVCVSWRISDVSSNNQLTMPFVLFRENQYPASAGESTTCSPGVD